MAAEILIEQSGQPTGVPGAIAIRTESQVSRSLYILTAVAPRDDALALGAKR